MLGRLSCVMTSLLLPFSITRVPTTNTALSACVSFLRASTLWRTTASWCLAARMPLWFFHNFPQWFLRILCTLKRVKSSMVLAGTFTWIAGLRRPSIGSLSQTPYWWRCSSRYDQQRELTVDDRRNHHSPDTVSRHRHVQLHRCRSFPLQL